MADTPIALKAAGIWVMLSGVLMVFSSLVVVFVEEAIGIMIGILYMLFLVVVGVYLASIGRVVFRSEMGGLIGSLKGVALGALGTLSIVALLFEGFDAADPLTVGGMFFILNVLALVGEGAAVSLILRNRESFMPDEEEIERTERIISDVDVVLVGQCPNCGEDVESSWTDCPYCGARLPRICANCGEELDEFSQMCEACGTVAEVPEDMMREIEGIRARAETEPNPENRSTEYTKLGDRYTKVGLAKEALNSYELAVRDTSYARKRTLLMVKMARILHAIGEEGRAEEMLDRALSLDKLDYAGASKMRASFNEA